jgi:OmcA/MtrC family decaheme c-type cytochrome
VRTLTWLFACAATALALAACGGGDGATGPAGPPGPPGPTGPGAPGPTGSLTGDLNGTITAVAIDAAAGQRVTVTFTLKDAAGLPVVGAETKGFDFHIAKLIPGSNSVPTRWQSYVNRSTRGFSGTGTPVLAATYERGNPVAVASTPGTYTYTFCTTLGSVASFQYYGSGTEPAGSCSTTAVSRSGALSGAGWDAIKGSLNLAYEASATTRIAIAGPTGSFVNIVKDFVPAQLPALLTTVTNQVATNASCGACHAENSSKRDKLVIGEKGSGHTGRRFDVELCTVCHNPGSFDPATSSTAVWKTVDLKVLTHELHAAEFPQGDSFGGVSDIRNPAGNVPGLDTGLPDGVRPRFNGAPGVITCRNCHDNQNDKILPFQPANRAAADKIAWQTNPSKQACGSCHDGTILQADGTPRPPIDFSNHFGNQADNSQCALCHGQGRSAAVAPSHSTPYSTPNNPEVYPGAKVVKYEIASVTVDVATGAPTVRFRVLVGDTFATATPVNLKAPPVGVCVLANCQNGNSAAGLNFRVTWARPMAQPTAADSGPPISAPADWNNFASTTSGRGYWNQTTNLGASKSAFDQPQGWTVNSQTALNLLSVPDAQGYHTVTLPAPARFPASPVYETLTLKAVAMESYLVINNYNISGEAVIKAVDGTPERRKIVDMLNCDTCHERVGFHSNAGRANNADYCAACHNPEITSSNLWSGSSAWPKYGTTVYSYSQRSNNFKDMIHAIHAGAFRKTQNASDPFNFIRGNPNATSGGAGPMVFENVIYPAQISDCQTCHRPGTYGLPSGANLAWSAVDLTNALGTANAAAGTTPDATNLLHDPLKTKRIGPAEAACGTCHNSVAAKTHYSVNKTATGESCSVCHGPGATFEAHKN